jgi:hypothetical protein
MSRLPSATGAAALNVPAARQDALRQDALGPEAQALPTMALGSDKEEAPLVMVAVWSAKKSGTGEVYFAQVYGGSPDDLYFISSVGDLVNLLDNFASIEHLIILAHAYDDNILFGKTPAQLQASLASVMPAVKKLTFDGCTAGKEALQLYNMAVALKVSELQAWSYFHHMEVWGRPEKNPTPNEDLGAVLEFAAPYIPRGSSGAHVPASQLKAQFDAQGTFAVVTEFFTYNLEPELTFETLTARVTTPGPTGPPLPEPWTRVRTPSEAEFPRAAIEDLVITSSGGAEAAVSRLKSVDAPPYKVIIRP